MELESDGQVEVESPKEVENGAEDNEVINGLADDVQVNEVEEVCDMLIDIELDKSSEEDMSFPAPIANSELSQAL